MPSGGGLFKSPLRHRDRCLFSGLCSRWCRSLKQVTAAGALVQAAANETGRTRFLASSQPENKAGAMLVIVATST